MQQWLQRGRLQLPASMPDSFSLPNSPCGLGAPNDDPTPLCAQSHDAEALGIAEDFLFAQILFPLLS